MSGDTLAELEQAVAAALRRLEDRAGRTDVELAELRSLFEQLLDVLVAKRELTEGHRRLFTRVAERVARERRQRVHLAVYPDKYAIPPVDIDCASLLHLCHGRCCSFTVELSRQDLDEGGISWKLDEPYLLRHDPDGWCTHLDRKGRGCTIYDRRPAACRHYDCRQDARVWVDFETRTPAPMPPGLKPLG